MLTYYQVFGVEPTATIEEIESAHRVLMMALHPDRIKRTVSLVSDLNEALRVLTNEREQYDAWLAHMANIDPQQADVPTQQPQTFHEFWQQTQGMMRGVAQAKIDEVQRQAMEGIGRFFNPRRRDGS